MSKQTAKPRGVVRRIRLALIGAGWIANGKHYPSLAERVDVEMAALCDLVPERLQKTADRFHIPRQYTDYRKMLDEVKPDAVYCLMPPHHVFDIAVEVLRRKHHLFVEKPLALNSFQARALAQHAAQNGCLTMTGYNRRYAPLCVEAKRLLDEAGGVKLCRAVIHKHASVLYYDGAIEALACDAIHAVDLLRFMGGEVAATEGAVTTFASDLKETLPNCWIAVARFANGGVGELSVNWASAARWLYFEMHNPEVSVLCEPEAKMVVKRHNEKKPKVLLAAEMAGSNESRVIGGFKQENDHFIECVKAGRQPQSNFADAVKSAELAERIAQGKL